LLNENQILNGASQQCIIIEPMFVTQTKTK
jgi:hypothetical protein